jgi:hypothetical protein
LAHIKNFEDEMKEDEEEMAVRRRAQGCDVSARDPLVVAKALMEEVRESKRERERERSEREREIREGGGGRGRGREGD